MRAVLFRAEDLKPFIDGLHEIREGRGRKDLGLDDIDETAFDRRHLDREPIPAYLWPFVASEEQSLLLKTTWF